MTLPIDDPVLIVAVSALIFLLAPLLMDRLRIPGLIGLILAGAVVGPNALNLLDRSGTIVLLGTVGLLWLMFMAGIEIDLHEFKRQRRKSATFGAATFLFPQVLGTGIMLALGYDWAAAILIASMFASHTLVSYPVALRLGIGKSPSVTTAVGATMITDIAALLVLAVVVASTVGDLDTAFWTRLGASLVVYALLVWYVLPRIARDFFRSEKTGATSEFIFVFAALFVGAFLAEVAGIEPIVGAFLVGLSLNRLIPEQSVLANRIHFVGDAIFIPFFLLSVGMLIDVRVLFADARVWEVMIAMTATVTATKWIAAIVTKRIVGFSNEEGWMMFGLSVPQAAATLAAALIGVQVGILDDAVLNGAIMMIFVTCVIGPAVVGRYGRVIALREELSPIETGRIPQRILVPISNPATADALMDLALALHAPDSKEPIHPMTVVPGDLERATEHIALAEKMLSHAVAYASGVDVPVVPLTRVDHNFASGIGRGAVETRSSTIVIGWDARRTTRQRIFGTVLDQLLAQTKQNVLVAKVGHPLNTTARILLLVPEGSDRVPGFFEMARAVKLLASRLGADIQATVVAAPSATYQAHLDAVKPEAPVEVKSVEDWERAMEALRSEARRDDLVVLLSARRGAISWTPALDRLPARLADIHESFVVAFPAEAELAPPRTLTAGRTPEALKPEYIVVNLPGRSFPEILATIVATAFEGDRERAQSVTDRLVRLESEFTTEIRPGVVAPHLRVEGLERSMMFLGISPDGVDFPHATAPAHLVFVVLTPYEPAQEHLHQLAEVGRIVSDAARVEALREARSATEVLELLGMASPT